MRRRTMAWLVVALLAGYLVARCTQAPQQPAQSVVGTGALTRTTASVTASAPTADVASNDQMSLLLDTVLRHATTVQVGERYQDEVTSRSFLNVADGSRSVVYRVQAEKGQRFEFSTQGPLDARIAVLRHGFVVASTEGVESYCNDDSELQWLSQRHTQLLFEADTTAEYLISVSGKNAYGYGPFELQVNAVASSDTPQDLVPGKKVEAWSVGGDVAYTLVIAQAGLFNVEASSCSFDAALELQGNGLRLYDDDNGDGYFNPRITAYLEAGTYTVRVKGSYGVPRGKFVVDVQEQSLPEGVELQISGDVALGQSIAGFLSGSDSVRYRLKVPHAGTVRMHLSSEVFDPYISVRGMGDEFYDDDSGGGPLETDAELVEYLRAGEYEIEVSGSGAGLFHLSVEWGKFSM